MLYSTLVPGLELSAAQMKKMWELLLKHHNANMFVVALFLQQVDVLEILCHVT